VAAPAFKEFMAAALNDQPAIPFRIPPGIELVRVNPATGKLARAGDRNVIYEPFKPGTVPSGRDAGVVIDGGAAGPTAGTVPAAATTTIEESDAPQQQAAPSTGTGGLY
jgi:penicillin-binding protein 1A